MSERYPSPESLDGYLLGDMTLQEWHTFLNVDQQTGDYTGHLAVPCSRYGRTSEECAWYAVAAETIYAAEYGTDDHEVDVSIDYYMALAVNDHPDVATLIAEYWDLLPRGLQEQLGDKDDVQQLIDGGW